MLSASLHSGLQAAHRSDRISNGKWGRGVLMSSINITGGRRSIADGAIGATLGGTGLGASCVGAIVSTCLS